MSSSEQRGGAAEPRRVRLEVRGHLGRITLDNPPQNALDRPDMLAPERLERFFARPELKAVLLCGAGRHFSAGASEAGLEALRRDPDGMARALRRGRRSLELLRFCPVPLLALVRGSCLGGGLELCLAAPLRWASKNALFGLPEAGLGLMPGLGGVGPLVEAVGGRAAAELLLSGELLGAERALELGLVQRAEPTAALEERAVAHLEALVGGREPAQVRAIMTAVHNARRLPPEQALQREGELFLGLVRGTAR